MSKVFKIWVLLVVCLLIGCEKPPATFSLLAETDSYKQVAQPTQTKLDVLWVIDNSGSMRTSQESVAANFQSFIHKFQERDYDFQIAVTTSDAYRAAFLPNDPAWTSVFKDGTAETGYSGVKVIVPSTPNIETVFITNIVQGILGHGDERAFQSLHDALLNPLNNGFVREDAFLAVIIVSDEDDFSYDELPYIGRDYNNPAFHSINKYVTFLDDLKPPTAGQRNYSVSAIAIFDDECLDELNDFWPGRIVGRRYSELVDATQGVKGSLCSNFGDTLEIISNEIVKLTTRFALSRVPRVETIQVFVNDVQIETDEKDGWTYHADENIIVFHGNAVPPDGAKVIIAFDPLSFKD